MTTASTGYDSQSAHATSEQDIASLTASVEQHASPITKLRDAVAQVVVGQASMVEGLLIGLLTSGHVLLEGVPGLAKTLTVSTLANGLHASFQRLQFTPDLLPADLIGTLIYSPKDGTFTARKGPVFANIVLADEINRAPAKVQSALLEAMQERQVTLGDETHTLPDPFLVLATQNPIEQEGTYPLPEAQVDRFLLKLTVTYPTREQERLILDRMAGSSDSPAIDAVVDLDAVRAARDLVNQLYIDPRVRDYIVSIVHATRDPANAEGGPLNAARLIDFGASPRATIALARAGRAKAFLERRGFVTPQDVKDVALPVLRHRVLPSYEAEAEGVSSDDLVRAVLDHIPVP